jgi:hypothetical protein
MLLSDGRTMFYGDAHAAADWFRLLGQPVPFGESRAERRIVRVDLSRVGLARRHENALSSFADRPSSSTLPSYPLTLSLPLPLSPLSPLPLPLPPRCLHHRPPLRPSARRPAHHPQQPPLTLLSPLPPCTPLSPLSPPSPAGVSTADHLLDLACGDLPGKTRQESQQIKASLMQSFESRTIGESPV